LGSVAFGAHAKSDPIPNLQTWDPLIGILDVKAGRCRRGLRVRPAIDPRWQLYNGWHIEYAATRFAAPGPGVRFNGWTGFRHGQTAMEGSTSSCGIARKLSDIRFLGYVAADSAHLFRRFPGWRRLTVAVDNVFG
jgi:hypothetical protein